MNETELKTILELCDFCLSYEYIDNEITIGKEELKDFKHKIKNDLEDLKEKEQKMMKALTEGMPKNDIRI